MLSMKINKGALAYSATTFAATLMNSVFMFYYVKVFVKKYNVTSSWFQASQVIFLVWNAINDPLFGYVQDKSNWKMFKSRRLSVLYGSPFFALSFIIPWFSWSTSSPIISGLHLLFSLCFYDTLFTFVLLAQCALFSEMTCNINDKITYIRYAQVASLLGSTAVFFCDSISNGLEVFERFQTTTIILGIVAFFCLRYTGLRAQSRYDLTQLLDKDNEEKDEPGSMIETIKQLLTKPMITFVIMNFFHVYRMNFVSNFSLIICDQLISKEILYGFNRAFFYGLLNFLPQVSLTLLIFFFLILRQ